jgi:nitroreductase
MGTIASAIAGRYRARQAARWYGRPVEFGDVVRKRRMVHVFEDRPVAADLVDRLLDTARRGPSAGYSQGTDFLVLDESASLARFWQLVDDPSFPREPGELDGAPPVLVLLLADPDRYVERYSRPDKIAFGLDHADAWRVKFWDTDTAMAGMLLLLAAVAAGLGGWYFGVSYGEPELRREFGIPDGRNIIGVVGIGYAGHDERPRGSAYTLARRPLDDMVHRNHW